MNNLADSVTAFIRARAARPMWPGVPIDAKPASLNEAYRLQAAIHARLAAQGITRVGYKIGSSSAASQRPFGLTEPVYAGIFTDTQFDTLAAAFARPMLNPSLECEIAFRLRADIDGADPGLSIARVIDAIGSCHIGCEIIDRRYDDPDAIGVPSLLADDFFHAGFVLGHANPTWRTLDFHNLDGVIEIDGERETGSSADTLDAVTATIWLARKLAAFGTKLRTGEIILSGTLPRPTPITLPARAVALSISGFEPLVL